MESNSLHSRIDSKLQEIAECIYHKVCNQDKIKGLGLYSGEFGILLFLYHYAQYVNNPKYIEIAETYSKRLLNAFENNITSHTFCDGMSGINRPNLCNIKKTKYEKVK